MSPLFRAGFVQMDDPVTIAQNPLFKDPGLSTVGHHWVSFARGLYAPVTYTVWTALAAFSRDLDPRETALYPWVFHGANVVIHVATALVVALLLRSLLGADRSRTFRSGYALTLGTLVFAIHPLQVESIAWASGTKDLLAGLFGLSAILLHVVGARADRRRPILRAAALLCAALAMLSKPSAMTIPGVALVLDWLVIRRPLRIVLRSLLPWFALSIACMAIAWVAQPAPRATPVPLWARPLLVGDSLTFYLWKLIAPWNLAVCYGRTPGELVARASFYVMWIAPTAMLTLLIIYRNREPLLLAALAVFIIAPSPMLGLFRFDYQYFSTVADHYLYVAMLGPALAAGWAVDRFQPRVGWKVTALVAMALSALTFRQSRVWRDDFTLFSHSVDVAPRGVLALHNLGNDYQSKGYDARAAELYRRAVDARPTHYESMGPLAIALARMNRTDEAVVWFRRFLKEVESLPSDRQPRDYPTYLLSFAEELKRRGDYEEAITSFQRLLEIEPNNWAAMRDLQVTQEMLKRRNRGTTTTTGTTSPR